MQSQQIALRQIRPNFALVVAEVSLDLYGDHLDRRPEDKIDRTGVGRIRRDASLDRRMPERVRFFDEVSHVRKLALIAHSSPVSVLQKPALEVTDRCRHETSYL